MSWKHFIQLVSASIQLFQFCSTNKSLKLLMRYSSHNSIHPQSFRKKTFLYWYKKFRSRLFHAFWLARKKLFALLAPFFWNWIAEKWKDCLWSNFSDLLRRHGWSRRRKWRDKNKLAWKLPSELNVSHRRMNEKIFEFFLCQRDVNKKSLQKYFHKPVIESGSLLLLLPLNS